MKKSQKGTLTTGGSMIQDKFSFSNYVGEGEPNH